MIDFLFLSLLLYSQLHVLLKNIYCTLCITIINNDN